MTGIGGTAGREYERWRSSSADQAKAALIAANAYESLGDLPRRAGEFIGTKREGTKDDVRRVARLLRSMMFDIDNGRYSEAHFQTAIGGRAEYWSNAFAVLSDGKSPASKDFTLGERKMFRALSNDLKSLLSLYGKSFDSEAVDVSATAQDGRALAEYR